MCTSLFHKFVVNTWRKHNDQLYVVTCLVSCKFSVYAISLSLPGILTIIVYLYEHRLDADGTNRTVSLNFRPTLVGWRNGTNFRGRWSVKKVQLQYAVAQSAQWREPALLIELLLILNSTHPYKTIILLPKKTKEVRLHWPYSGNRVRSIPKGFVSFGNQELIKLQPPGKLDLLEREYMPSYKTGSDLPWKLINKKENLSHPPRLVQIRNKEEWSLVQWLQVLILCGEDVGSNPAGKLFTPQKLSIHIPNPLLPPSLGRRQGRVPSEILQTFP
jgi:hypothetical protein